MKQAPESKYRFNGKELQDENNLSMLDFGARMYDPQIGRWWSVDPMAEKYLDNSPYHFVANNPINLIDPNGMEYGDPGTPGFGWEGIKDKVKDWIKENILGWKTDGMGLWCKCSKQETEKEKQTRIKQEMDAETVNQLANVDAPSGQGGFNEDKAISYLKNNFILPYGAGQCINHMVPALIEGGITGLKGKTIKAACLYGPILKNLGFVTVNRTNTYYKGDIAIIQGYDGGTYCEGSGVVCGHIQMYDGKQWISDFPQSRPFWPGKGYADATPSPSFEILHWGGN